VHAGGRPDLGSDGQALLEAVLIHLRLLDDFLGNRKQRVRSVNRWNVWKRWRVWRRRPHVQDDVFARHWNPTWAPRQFLSKLERKRMNQQLAHLSSQRLIAGWNIQPSDLPDLVEHCCLGMEAFFGTLDPLQQLPAFRPAPDKDAPKRVDDYLHHRAARNWAT
jgi:hypothetical protein